MEGQPLASQQLVHLQTEPLSVRLPSGLQMLMQWSPGAVVALEAVRQRLDPEYSAISTVEALLAWADIPLPGQSVLHTALRDGTLWINLSLLRQHVRLRQGYSPGTYHDPGIWEQQAEQHARQEGVLRVGERHLLACMTDDELAHQVRAVELRTLVRELELGTLALGADEKSRFHLVPDTSALVEYYQPDQVIWAEALGKPGVVVQLWVLGTVLNELDDLKRHENRKVADRARDRGRWLWKHIPTALKPVGAQVRSECHMRVWRHQSVSPFRDTDHLEAALELRSLGVPVSILTDDTLMLARATTVELPVVRLEGRWRLAKNGESTPLPSLPADAAGDV